MPEEIQKVQKLIFKDFEIEDSGIAYSSIEKLKIWLASEIRNMMDRDFQKLLNMLYRIDVDEQKTRLAFMDEDPAVRLTELIIERELRKVKTREKYK